MGLGVLDWVVFLGALACTLAAAFYARGLRGANDRSEAVAGRSIGPWLLGLSAGATGNSGVALTACVGLGYSYGLMWLALPLGWLLGDIIFWLFLAERLNAVSRRVDAVTLPEMLYKGCQGAKSPLPRKLLGLLIPLLSMGYVGAQWLAAGKIAGLVLGLPVVACTLAFALFVIGYTAFSGVRGSIYTDFVQAIFMLLLVAGVAVALAMAWHPAVYLPAEVPEGFFSLLGSGPWWHAPLLVLGFAVMAVGFDLGQPQMAARWMTGDSAATMRKARWVYIGFIQATFMTFMLFGVVFRLLMPHLADPEQGLAAFVVGFGGMGMVGLLLAGAVATIASTASGIISVGAEMVRLDLLPGVLRGKAGLALAVLMVGVVSLAAIPLAHTDILAMALTAVGLMSAVLLAPMLWVVMGWMQTQAAMMASVLAALAAAVLWMHLGLSGTLNEVVPGALAGVLVMLAAGGGRKVAAPVKKKARRG
ncbi:MAG: hypothetical protein GC129_00145 [Proteobacteria bacterium]|nr:hypothetical protein [Pseudomonadota bacterium]